MGHFFDPRYEQRSINKGIAEQQHETGQTIWWWFYDKLLSAPDPVYGEGGAKYTGPHPIPVLQYTRREGELGIAGGEGIYPVDSVTLSIGYQQAADAGLLPRVDDTHDHYRDRFVLEGKVYSPSLIISRNLLGGGGTRSMIVIDATQVRADELENDIDFLALAAAPFHGYPAALPPTPPAPETV